MEQTKSSSENFLNLFDMTNVAKIIGIDISKEKFDVCFSSINSNCTSCSYAYDKNGIKSFLKDVPQNSICIMEATGVYHLKLAYALYEKDIFVSVVNPLSAKNFSRAVMCRTKTDKSDAKQLVEYAKKMDLVKWEPTADNYIRIQQMYRSIELLQINITQANNQIEAILNSPIYDKTLLVMLQKHIKHLRKCIERLEEQIEKSIGEDDAHAIKRICSIPGVGKKTAIAILTSTKGLRHFYNYRQVSSYFGLCPRIYDSGKSVHGKAHICKMGMGWIRKLLYMCSISAIRYNSACIALYERLREKGKPVKVAMIAVVNKLLKQIFAIVKNNCFYDENFSKNICF